MQNITFQCGHQGCSKVFNTNKYRSKHEKLFRSHTCNESECVACRYWKAKQTPQECHVSISVSPVAATALQFQCRHESCSERTRYFKSNRTRKYHEQHSMSLHSKCSIECAACISTSNIKKAIELQEAYSKRKRTQTIPNTETARFNK